MKRNRIILFFTKSSIFLNVIIGLYKIILSIVSKSILLFIYAFYNIGIVIVKTTIMKNIKKDYDKFYLVGAIVVASSVCFIINSIRTIYLKRSPKYNMVLALAIAAVTFLEICIAIGGIISARKRNDLKIESLKLVSLANSLISLTLVQTAILSFTTKGNMSLYNGISGIVFGSCATLIGFYMIFYIKKNTKKKLPEGNY